jgi:hypothetical protein
MHEQPANDARALRRKDARRPSRPSEPIGSSVDDDAKARRDDVRVPAEIEPGHSRRLTCLPSSLAHEGHDNERDDSPPELLRDLDHALGARSDRADRRRAEHLHDERLPGSRKDEVRSGSVLVPHLDLVIRNTEQSGECGRHLCK